MHIHTCTCGCWWCSGPPIRIRLPCSAPPTLQHPAPSSGDDHSPNLACPPLPLPALPLPHQCRDLRLSVFYGSYMARAFDKPHLLLVEDPFDATDNTARTFGVWVGGGKGGGGCGLGWGDPGHRRRRRGMGGGGGVRGGGRKGVSWVGGCGAGRRVWGRRWRVRGGGWSVVVWGGATWEKAILQQGGSVLPRGRWP